MTQTDNTFYSPIKMFKGESLLTLTEKDSSGRRFLIFDNGVNGECKTRHVEVPFKGHEVEVICIYSNVEEYLNKVIILNDDKFDHIEFNRQIVKSGVIAPTILVLKVTKWKK